MNMSYSAAHGTLVNCIDGTVQMSAIDFLKKTWNIQWVDVITDAAPEKMLAEAKCQEHVDHMYDNIEASLCSQQTKRLAVLSHSGCDMNKAPDDRKLEMLRRAVDRLRIKYADVEVVGIWANAEGALTILNRKAT